MSIIRPSRSVRWRFLVTVSVLALVAVVLRFSPTSQVMPTSSVPTVGMLVRGPDVIQAKLERKRKKLAGQRSPEQAAAREHRDEQRYLARLGADGIPALSPRVRAKAHLDLMPQISRDAGLGHWDWLGPGNVGGRIRAILPDPNNWNNLMIGSVSGGIWRSTNAGASWSPVNDFMANLNVTHIARDGSDSDILYAATGEGFSLSAPPGDGIFRSLDGGDTWDQIPSTDTEAFQWVTRLATHPSSTGLLYATTARGSNGVYRSTDYGDTWEQLLNWTERVTDIKVHPIDPLQILVGTRIGGVRSTDGGTSWESLSVGGNDLPDSTGRVEFAWGSDATAYASVDANFGELWRTTNYGDTWTLQNSQAMYLDVQGWYDNVVWVHPTNSDAVVFGGIDLFRSQNGGLSPLKISDWRGYHVGTSAHADQHAIVPHPAGDGRMYFGNDGGIQTCNVWSVSQNNGWTNLANGLGITQFSHGAASPNGSIVIGGSQDNDNIRYEDGDGPNGWFQAETGDGGFCAVDFDNPDILYTEYIYLEMEKSTNGGDSFFKIGNGLRDQRDWRTALFIAPFAMHTSNPNTLYAGGINLWKTTNGGSNWSNTRVAASDSARASSVDIAPSNGSNIWFGYENGRVSRSFTGGTSWNDVDQNGLPGAFVTDIDICPSDPNEVLVSTGGTSENLWRTTNSGASWAQITGAGDSALPPIQINTVTFHPTETDWIYVGTDIGVFASGNRGQTWNTMPRYEDNEGPANVEIGELFWYSDHLVAATFGRGMFVTRPLPTVFVDGSYSGIEEGTLDRPFDSVIE